MERSYLTTVKNLLNKAESLPENNPERAALELKALELMARKGIDRTMIDAANKVVEDIIIDFMRTFDAPYAVSKADLYGSIAGAFRCEVIKLGGKDKKYHIFGFRNDIDNVEELYTMLLLYGSSQLTKTRIPAGVHMKSFTTSWWVGFNYQISNRLKEANKSAEREATQIHGPGTAIVLRDRKTAVTSKMRQEYKNLAFTRKQFSSAAGLRAGVDAAKGANIGGVSLGGASRRAIGR